MHEIQPNERAEAFGSGAWVVTILLLIAVFGFVLLFALSR
jgi:hypothetical protein